MNMNNCESFHSVTDKPASAIHRDATMNLNSKNVVPFEEALDKTGIDISYDFIECYGFDVGEETRVNVDVDINGVIKLVYRVVIGNGLYNILLVCTCALILLAVGVDLFGFGLVVTVACDLNLTVAEKGILTSLPYIGILLTSYAWGYISDTRGRRYTLVLSLFVGFVLSVISSFCYHWLLLALVKFFSICFSCAAQSATYTLLGESCVQRVRSKYMLLMTSMLLLSPAAAAVITYPVHLINISADIPWLGLVFTPWRLLIIILALPSGIGGLAIYFFYESPKFLANSGQEDEAIEVLKGIHRINQKFSCKDGEMLSLSLEREPSKKKLSLFYALFEQSAILFRPPFLWRTVQLFYIVAVVYITNNSFLTWLPHILNVVRISLDSQAGDTGNVCSLISALIEDNDNGNHENGNLIPASKLINGTWKGYGNDTFSVVTEDTAVIELSPHMCTGRIEDNVILTLIASQSLFAFLNLIISYLPNRRKAVLITVLCVSSLSGAMVNLIPESISSVLFFTLFTCTCLGMGILASYFVDLYPTSHRGMVVCLSIMVGRSATFIGINLVGNVIFTYCEITFYLWSLLILTSVVAAWFLPPDKPASRYLSTKL